jgi:hypothetical protein
LYCFGYRGMNAGSLLSIFVQTNKFFHYSDNLILMAFQPVEEFHTRWRAITCNSHLVWDFLLSSCSNLQLIHHAVETQSWSPNAAVWNNIRANKCPSPIVLSFQMGCKVSPLDVMLNKLKANSLSDCLLRKLLRVYLMIVWHFGIQIT